MSKPHETKPKSNLFTQHPHSINESYFVHFKFASLIGFKLIIAGLAAIIHSLFPFLFEKTASNIIRKICAMMDARSTPNTTL